MANWNRPGDRARCERLRALRKSQGLTQAQVAERSGLARTVVNKLENGWAQGTKHDTRLALARGLGVPVETLDAHLAGEAAGPAPAAQGA